MPQLWLLTSHTRINRLEVVSYQQHFHHHPFRPDPFRPDPFRPDLFHRRHLVRILSGRDRLGHGCHRHRLCHRHRHRHYFLRHHLDLEVSLLVRLIHPRRRHRKLPMDLVHVMCGLTQCTDRTSTGCAQPLVHSPLKSSSLGACACGSDECISLNLL